MITRRAHAISLIAVFLALAVGVVLGSGLLSGGVLAMLRGERMQLQEQVDNLSVETVELREQLDRADGFDASIADRVVREALTGKSVVLVAAADAGDDRLSAVQHIISAAGGSVAGTIVATDDLVDTTRGDDLLVRATSVVPAGVELSASGVDQGAVTGDLLGAVLLRGETPVADVDRNLVLETLRSGGYLEAGDLPAPADLAVVITGSRYDGNAGAVLARLTRSLDTHGDGAVLAGPGGAAQGSGPIATVRADGDGRSVSTVDGIERHAGLIALVLALEDRAAGGAGGYGPGAVAPVSSGAG